MAAASMTATVGADVALPVGAAEARLGAAASAEEAGLVAVATDVSADVDEDGAVETDALGAVTVATAVGVAGELTSLVTRNTTTIRTTAPARMPQPTSFCFGLLFLLTGAVTSGLLKRRKGRTRRSQVSLEKRWQSVADAQLAATHPLEP
jgi:hypothetical protein